MRQFHEIMKIGVPKLKFWTNDFWWKLVVVLLSMLLALQLLFNRHVHQITIYTYRVMQDYYRDNLGNMSRFIFIDADLILSDNSSFMDDTFISRKFWETTSKLQSKMERCSPNLTHVFSAENDSLSYVSHGGMWSPDSCKPWSKVALIIPFRWREPHLKHFLPYMHSFLQSQLLSYQIFVLEQYGNDTFNRAKLMNVGYAEARKSHNFDCYVFHDVDMLPLDSYTMYNCSMHGPIHMASAIDKWGFKMPYGGYFGGVCAFTEDQIKKINGFSNRFYGWGGEDDEIAMRIGFSGQNVQRYPINVGRYHMFSHGKDDGNDANPQRMNLLGQAHQSWKDDGLNNLNYILIKSEYYPLHTRVVVDVSEQKSSTKLKRATTLSAILINEKKSTSSIHFFLTASNGEKEKKKI